MLPGEQCPQLELGEAGSQSVEGVDDLTLEGVVTFFTAEPVEGVGVVEATGERPVEVEVVGGGGQLGVDLLGLLGVVPEVGAAGLGLELGTGRFELGDAQVGVGVVEAAPQRVDVVGEVLHGVTTLPTGRGRA